MSVAKIYLAVIFMMILAAGAEAQDAYEYASITYSATVYAKYKISITKEGKYEEIEGKLTEMKTAAFENLTPVIEYLNKFSKDGWDNYNVNVTRNGADFTMYFFLRKEKP